MAQRSIPAPIDRPLSKSYLREFTGWSTAYSPGLADPTSLREMENILIGRDGSAVIRPALRNLFGDHWWAHQVDGYHFELQGLGEWESFFLEQYIGPSDAEDPETVDDYWEVRKAIIFPVRLKNSGAVTFRVALYNEHTKLYDPPMTLEEAGFAVNTDYGDDIVFPAEPYGKVESVKLLQIDNKMFALSDKYPLVLFNFVGTRVGKYSVKAVKGFETPIADPAIKPALTQAAGSKIREHDVDKDTSNALVFYTYINELGETLASPYGTWMNGSDTNSWKIAKLSSSWKNEEHIIATLDTAQNDAAVAAGATGLNVYYAEWSDQTAAPVEALQVYEGPIATTIIIDGEAIVNSPGSRILPNPTDINSTQALTVKNGLVAADRLILVGDFNQPARVHWSGNEMGAYGNMQIAKGAGYKTLTQGELQLPSSVVLWQNPQSVDTLTVLCEGVDSYSTAYYMAPADITSQTEATSIMAFEQTNATPGTVSPFGVHVFNNALYHPLDDQLMKSTANNYNVNHRKMTEQIGDRWQHLTNKNRIRVEEFDGRIYYIVNNPFGVAVPPGCNGNEIWVLDTAKENAPWSRLLIPAVALKRIFVDNRVQLGVVTPQSIMYLDDHYHMDHTRKGAPGNYSTVEKAIPWKLKTNTQGANRAHDAWAHVQQIGITMGSFYGTMRYGIESWTVEGKPLDISKVYRQPVTLKLGNKHDLPFDHEDYMQIRRDIKEWFFTASSETDPETGEVLPSSGQISLVQYRFSPVSVNVGYEYGSVETFEYGRSADNWTQRSSINGIPIPAIDPRRPQSCSHLQSLGDYIKNRCNNRGRRHVVTVVTCSHLPGELELLSPPGFKVTTSDYMTTSGLQGRVYGLRELFKAVVT